MKLLSVFNKSLKEQLRHFWIFLLTVTMAPFFILVYYLITEVSQPHYDVLVINQDTGIEDDSGRINHGSLLTDSFTTLLPDTFDLPLTVTAAHDKATALAQLENRKADALIIIPENFSRCIHDLSLSPAAESVNLEFVGDLTNINYLISAVWTEELLNNYLAQTTPITRPLTITETSLGVSGSLDDFDMLVPGILILSLVMLMFSATLAFITEVENRTILRLKLSRLTAVEFLIGVSLPQVLIGLIAIGLTLIVAVALGFKFTGSVFLFILITLLTSVSIIAFSLIVAALTKTANEVLIVGNFPLFLFMFFTGVAFPIQGRELFSVAGYSVTLHGLMSPTHAVSALNKVLIMNQTLTDILPEITALIILTLFYFIIGAGAFKSRHLKIA